MPNQNDNRAMIEAVSLCKRYGDGTLAVDDMSFSIERGCVFAMLGGNGAGKTTAINLFMNLIPATSGEAFIDGHSAQKEPLKAKVKLAFVSENVMLYPNFTALQNLDYFVRLGGRKDITRDECRAVLRRVGLQEEAHDKRLKGFSKGMRQKCGIAIAILKDAPAILLDEPTSGLDPRAGLEFLRLLDDLRSEGKAILMSTHDIFRAREIADRLGIMHAGRLVMEKSRRELVGVDLESLYVEYMGGAIQESQPDQPAANAS